MRESERRDQPRRLAASLVPDRRDLYNGSGDALARAFELALTPAIFGLLGWLLDRWLGTAPLFLVVFVVGVFAYCAWKLYLRYDADMQRHERDVLGGRSPGEPGGAAS